MKYVPLLAILFLAVAVAQVAPTGFFQSSFTTNVGPSSPGLSDDVGPSPPVIIGPATTSEGTMNNYFFVSSPFIYTTYDMEVYSLDTGKSEQFYDLPFHINYIWRDGEAGRYELRVTAKAYGMRSATTTKQVLVIATSTTPTVEVSSSISKSASVPTNSRTSTSRPRPMWL